MSFFFKEIFTIKRATYILNEFDFTSIPCRIWYNINKRIVFIFIKNGISIINSLCLIMSYEIIVVPIHIEIYSKLLEKCSFYSCRTVSILSFKIYLFLYKKLSEKYWIKKFSYVIIISAEYFTILVFITFYNLDWKRNFIFIYIRISYFIIIFNFWNIRT